MRRDRQQKINHKGSGPLWLIVVELACGKGADELAVLGAIFTQLGDTLATMSTQQSLIDAKKSNA